MFIHFCKVYSKMKPQKNVIDFPNWKTLRINEWMWPILLVLQCNKDPITAMDLEEGNSIS